MIRRYTHPAMGRIWTEQRRYETWLEVELAAADAMAAVGLVPADAARELRDKAAFEIERIEEIERTTQHDVIAFTTAVAEHVGPSARWLHFGLTSSDVVDTAQALQMVEATDLVLTLLSTLREAVKTRAGEHRRTAMIGRTHGVHAEPMTFGLKLALWYDQLGRAIRRVTQARATIAVGKISGAVGTFAHLDPSIEADVCRRLGLAAAPISTQVIQRDRHAELLSALAITAASLETFALEIRGLQKTEIGEVEEPFAKGQKGSSAMPHKRNPIGCEQIVGLARLLRANAMAAFENVALWHERDISHSSVASCRAWWCTPNGCARTSNAPVASSSPVRCCWNSPDATSRANGPTSGYSAMPCARSTSGPTSSRCCWPTPTSRRCWAPPRSSGRSTSTNSSAP